MGGRGASGGGGALGGSSGRNVDMGDALDVWSYRHNPNNQPFVDSINESVRAIQNDFPDIMNNVYTVNATEFKGADRTQVLGCYSYRNDGYGELHMNKEYTDVGLMNATYDASVKSGFHPSRGSKNGTEAVALHEMGHALNNHLAQKMGAKSMDDAAKQIVTRAANNIKVKNHTDFAKTISGYAKESYAECIAEAVADVYCNGKNAARASRAIMDVMKSI